MKKILVTGGAGFIGSHLCQKLLEENNYVICLDNLQTGSLKNIESIRSHKNFEFIRHDITQPILLEVDQIYHLACPASPVAYQKNAIKTIKTNVLGTMNTLGIAKRTKARYLLTSTSEVYGDPQISPQVEEYWGNVNPIGIRSCYDEGKRLAEAMTMEYFRVHNVEIRIARIFNTYGPNMQINDGRVVSNFITQSLQDKDITVYGDGSQTRSLCFVSDLVAGLILLMNGNSIGPINLGNPNEITIKSFAEKIKDIIPNSTSNIIYQNLPEDDPKRRKPDITKAKNLLGWTPKVNLNQGLSETIKYFQSALENQ